MAGEIINNSYVTYMIKIICFNKPIRISLYKQCFCTCHTSSHIFILIVSIAFSNERGYIFIAYICNIKNVNLLGQTKTINESEQRIIKRVYDRDV